MGMALTVTPLFRFSIATTTTATATRQPCLRRPDFFFAQRKSNLYSQRLFTRNTACSVSCNLVKVEDGLNDEACELVNGVELSIGDGNDSIQAYLCTAVKNNNETGVLVLSDIFGFEDSSTRDFAYRVACNGYNVLVPDLFRGDPWGKDRPKTMFEQWMAGQDSQRVAKDIATATEWMVNEFMAAGISKKLGIIGFCFGGGRVIEVLARDQGTCFGIGVSFYGTRIDQSLASNIKIPMKTCEDCGGSGICSECRGEGFVLKKLTEQNAEKARLTAKNAAIRYTAGLPKKWSYCTKCSSARSCNTCAGQGKVII